MVQRISDLVDNSDPQGRTFRQINECIPHNIPVGALVEIIDTKERLIVIKLTRDCDGTPIYTLGLSGNENFKAPGYPEYCLKQVSK